MSEPTVVMLTAWRGVDPSTGRHDVDRWSLEYADRTLISRGSELECQRYAREMGWRVVASRPGAEDGEGAG